MRLKSTDDVQTKGFNTGTRRGDSNYPYAGTTDSWRRQRSPEPCDLIDEYESTAYACANLNADALMSLSGRLYLRSAKGVKNRFYPTRSLSRFEVKSLQTMTKLRLSSAESVEEVTAHPFLDLMANPNPELTWPELVQITQLFQEIVGVAYWHRAIDRLGRPQELNYLKSHLVRPIRENGSGKVVAYDYGFGKDKVTFPASEIIKFEMPFGVSPLRSVWESVSITSKLEATQASMLDNEAIPQLLVSPAGDDGYMGEPEQRRYEMRWKQKFARGAGGIVFTDEPVNVKQLSFSPRDLSALQIKGASKIEICNGFGTPVALLEGNQFNRATLEGSRLQHAQSAIVPRAQRMQGVLNKFLLSMYDPTGRLFFAFEDPSPEDRTEKMTEVTNLRNARIITANEARKEYGLPPHEDGDVLVDPMPGMQGLDEQADVEPVEAGTEATTPEVGKPVEDVQATALNGSQISSMVAIAQAVANGEIPPETGEALYAASFPNLTPEQISRIVAPLVNYEPRKPEAEPAVNPPFAEEPNEPEVEADDAVPAKSFVTTKADRKKAEFGVPDGDELGEVVAGFFRRKRVEIVGSLQKGIGRKALPERFTPLDSWTEELGEACRPLIELYVSKSGQSLMDRVGFSAETFSVTNPLLKEAIEKMVFNFCESTVESTTKQLNEALDELRSGMQDGLHAGDRLTDLRDTVNGIFDGLSKDHAFTIAATEASRAHHQGLRLAAKQSGVVAGFKLLLSSDACPECQAVNDKNPEIGIDGYFARDEKARDGFQDVFVPLHPKCRCSVTEILHED